MKSFLRGILTVWIVILLIVFGLVGSMKTILIDTADGLVKKELKTNIVKVIEDYSNEKIPEDVIKKVEKEIDSNKNIKKLMNTYYDKIIDVLSNKEKSVTIDVEKELKVLIDNGEEVLKDYGITLTSEEKQELLETVSTTEINDLVNDSIKEIKSNISDDAKTIIDIYAFLTSVTFKIILIALIVVALLFIALLKKSWYGWLSNFGISSIITGVLMGIIVPVLIGQVITSIASENNISISINSLNTYGYILMGLGIVSVIINVIIKKLKDNNVKEDINA